MTKKMLRGGGLSINSKLQCTIGVMGSHGRIAKHWSRAERNKRMYTASLLACLIDCFLVLSWLSSLLYKNLCLRNGITHSGLCLPKSMN